MAGPIDPKNPDGGQMPPGSGYIPPGSAVLMNGLSSGSGGVAAAAPLVLMTLAWSVKTAGGDFPLGVERGTPHNLSLVAGLMLAALFFAALALVFTALADRYWEKYDYKVLTPKGLLWTYTLLTLLGLGVNGLALDFLARRAFASFHLAAIVGALLELAAFAVGAYSLWPALKMKLARQPEKAVSGQGPHTAKSVARY